MLIIEGGRVTKASKPRQEWPLTPRQMQCLELLWSRLSVKQIAGRLSITDDTVEAHLKQCRQRLGTTSSMDAARLVFGDDEEITVKPYYDRTGIPADHHPLQFELTPTADGQFGRARTSGLINTFSPVLTFGIVLAIALAAIFAVVLLVQVGQGIRELGLSMGY